MKNPFRLRYERGAHTFAGDGDYEELRTPLGFYVYARRRVQRWTSYCCEIEVEQGYRFRSWRWGLTKCFVVTTDKDGNETIRRGRYAL